MSPKKIALAIVVIGFFIQILGRNLGTSETTLPGGISYMHVMLLGLAVFTIGSIQYARAKGRLWTWGLLGIIPPFFLVLVLIPSKH